ncbi:MAG TPA: glycine cleavage system protein GcvH [Jatrophihabitantaceae bacterium]|jgi:glycine cleavage system H protein|nr:glycine cleavage system protein GcvH [Jatrophihabitantaceae bacterium]
MSNIPDDLKYTAEHEWVRLSETDGKQIARIGITDFAQQALGEIVYVSLPAVGSSLTAGAAFGEVESTKSVSDLFAPLGGAVVARNETLDEQPELINSDPYGAGWIVDIEVSGDAATDELVDAATYATLAT